MDKLKNRERERERERERQKQKQTEKEEGQTSPAAVSSTTLFLVDNQPWSAKDGDTNNNDGDRCR